jgi:hypothetical protein
MHKVVMEVLGLEMDSLIAVMVQIAHQISEPLVVEVLVVLVL